MLSATAVHTDKQPSIGKQQQSSTHGSHTGVQQNGLYCVLPGLTVARLAEEILPKSQHHRVLSKLKNLDWVCYIPVDWELHCILHNCLAHQHSPSLPQCQHISQRPLQNRPHASSLQATISNFGLGLHHAPPCLRGSSTVMTADANVAHLTITYKLEVHLTSCTDLLWRLMTNVLLSCEHQGSGNVIGVTVCSVVLHTINIAKVINYCKCCCHEPTSASHHGPDPALWIQDG